jgi:hypothetical protein
MNQFQIMSSQISSPSNKSSNRRNSCECYDGAVSISSSCANGGGESSSDNTKDNNKQEKEDQSISKGGVTTP